MLRNSPTVVRNNGIPAEQAIPSKCVVHHRVADLEVAVRPSDMIQAVASALTIAAFAQYESQLHLHTRVHFLEL